jgi:hypothetical protein
MEYRFKENTVVVLPNWDKADPQEIGETLDAIRMNNGGELQPRHVVEEAKKPSSLIHRYFEWDNGKAANLFRVSQARKLIGCIEVVDISRNGVKSTPAFVSLNNGEGVSYRSVSDVIASKEMQKAIMEQAERDLRGYLRRYQSLKNICSDIESVIEKHF